MYDARHSSELKPYTEKDAVIGDFHKLFYAYFARSVNAQSVSWEWVSVLTSGEASGPSAPSEKA